MNCGKKASVVADYYKTAGDDYEVRCQARERKDDYFLRLS